jgi:hypothetical protein
VGTWETDDATFKSERCQQIHDDDVEQATEAAALKSALNAADLKLLERKFIRSKLGTTCVLHFRRSSIGGSSHRRYSSSLCTLLTSLQLWECASSADAGHDGQARYLEYNHRSGERWSKRQGRFNIWSSTCFMALYACNRACVFTCLCCFFLPLPTGATARQYRPQSWLVAVNVFFEDLPQLIITISSSILSSTFDIFTFANLVG